MISKVDVFVTNAMVSQLAAAGLDDETMRALHPRLLYVLLTPWGRAGPERPRGERGAFFAGSGMGQYLGGALPAPPVTLPDRAGDMMVATSVFAGTMAGLFHQRRTGEGQLVDIAEVRHAAFCMASMYGVFYKDPEKLKMFLIPPKDLALNHPLATYNAYMTKDGVWVQLLGLDIGRHLPKYLRVFGIQCKTYTRVLTALVLEVVPNYKEKNILLRAGPVFRVLNSALKEAFGCMTWKQAKLYCDKHDVWYSKVATPATALKNRQAHAGNTFLHTSDGLLVNCPTYLSSCGTDFDGFNNT
jgi:crotonobetainyl-CoA:carnitine CoA-transferase CaiB-like acyl-CoA transferase